MGISILIAKAIPGPLGPLIDVFNAFLPWLLVAIVGVLLLAFLMRGLGGRRLQFSRRELLSPAENTFLAALDQAVGDRFRIAMKVRIGDLISVSGEKSESQIARNKIRCKHVDFVLCTRMPVTAILVIELDDATHEQDDRRERDAFVDSCMESAGLPILHVRCARSYEVKKLRTDIEAKIGSAGASPRR